MRVNAMFNEEQPAYRYMVQPDGMAHIFIYKLIEETEDEDHNPIFIYDMNEIHVESTSITEAMVEENPLEYLDYSDEEFHVALEERVSAIEDAIEVMAEVIFND